MVQSREKREIYPPTFESLYGGSLNLHLPTRPDWLFLLNLQMVRLHLWTGGLTRFSVQSWTFINVRGCGLSGSSVLSDPGLAAGFRIRDDWVCLLSVRNLWLVRIFRLVRFRPGCRIPGAVRYRIVIGSRLQTRSSHSSLVHMSEQGDLRPFPGLPPLLSS